MSCGSTRFVHKDEHWSTRLAMPWWARDWPLYSVYYYIQLIVTGPVDMAVIRNTQVAAIQLYDNLHRNLCNISRDLPQLAAKRRWLPYSGDRRSRFHCIIERVCATHIHSTVCSIKTSLSGKFDVHHSYIWLSRAWIWLASIATIQQYIHGAIIGTLAASSAPAVWLHGLSRV